MHLTRGNEEYTVTEGHEWFWPMFADGLWEPSTFKIFDAFLEKNRPMLDIGAWIGPTVLYASKRASQVFAFEPDPVAYRSLVTNLRLNNTFNVIPYPVAVSNDWKGIDFGVRTQLGDSMSSELWGKDGDQVPAVAFKSLVADIAPAFIKIDIEGGEMHIFDGAQAELERIRPTIHLSLHTPWHIKDLDEFRQCITEGLEMYPCFYDENLQPIKLEDAFVTGAFNSVVASFKEIV